MATAAQIEANRRNSLKSTGPKSDNGKASSRANALKHGLHAFTLMPVLPQEDPERVDQRTREWMDSVQPQNALERDLTAQGASLTMDIERAHRLAVGHMARRVVMAARLAHAASPQTAAQADRGAGPQAALHRRAGRYQGRQAATRRRLPGAAGRRTRRDAPRAAAGCWSGGPNTAGCWTPE